MLLTVVSNVYHQKFNSVLSANWKKKEREKLYVGIFLKRFPRLIYAVKSGKLINNILNKIMSKFNFAAGKNNKKKKNVKKGVFFSWHSYNLPIILIVLKTYLKNFKKSISTSINTFFSRIDDENVKHYLHCWILKL